MNELVSRAVVKKDAHRVKEKNGMVYAVGIAGFIFGFIAGQMLLAYLLRHRSNAELMGNSGLKIYGVLNWLVAFGGAFLFVVLYRQYYGA